MKWPEWKDSRIRIEVIDMGLKVSGIFDERPFSRNGL